MPPDPEDTGEDDAEDGADHRHSASGERVPEGADAAGDEWRFSVDDFPEPGEDDEQSNVAGSLERDQPLEPGDIDLENAFFVALGVFIVVGLVVGAMLGF